MNFVAKCWYSAILMMCGGGVKRALIIKRHSLFGNVGENCSIQSWRLPIYPKLVYIHNNVIIATDVRFVVHNAIHNMLNKKYSEFKFVEHVDCIEIMDNVFIGSGTRILYNVRIGNNVIIGSGSLVNKDIPDNSVYAGVPAKKICSFDDYVNKARLFSDSFVKKYGEFSLNLHQEELFQLLYEDFCNRRNNTTIDDS